MTDRIDKFMTQAWKEFSKYKKTKDTTYLAQAGEKLWNCFNMIVERIVKHKIEKFADLKDAVFDIQKKFNDRMVYLIFMDLYDLHKFFYRGWTEDISIEEEQFLRNYYMLQTMRKIYKV